MAKHQIDELSLDIDIKAKKDIDKTISSLARAIVKLNNAVADVSSLNKYSNAIGKLIKASAKVPSKTAVGENLLKTQEVPDTSSNQTSQDFQKVAQDAKDATDSVKDFNQQLDISSKLKVGFKFPDNIGTKTSETISETKKLGEVVKSTYKVITDNGYKVITTQNGIIKSIKDVIIEQKKLDDATDDVGESGKKSAGFFGKFVKSIGRIALYRAIRTALSSIVKATQEGFNNFVQFDEQANKAMSNISNSFGQVKNTLGASFGNILQAIEPVIVMLSDKLVNLLDSFNMAMAKMSGKSTYQKAIKQNKDYADSLDETANKLLSFDKFEALNSGKENDPSKMFEEVSLAEESNKTVDIFVGVFEIIEDIIGLIEKLKPIMDTWLDLIKKVWVAIRPIVQPVIDLVGVLVDLLMPAILSIFEVIKSIVDVAGGIIQQISGVIQFISGLLKLLTGDFDGAWKSIANGFANMVNGIANMFIGLVNVILDMINYLLEPFDQIANFFGGDISELQWNAKVNWKPYANGGTFEKGTAFIAGEAGAEVVYNTGRGGQGGVLNVEEFRTAMVQALYDYGVMQNGNMNFSGDVVLDGRKVGQMVENAVYNEGVRVGHFKKA